MGVLIPLLLRRARDSNPHSLTGNGFQDRRITVLTSPPMAVNLISFQKDANFYVRTGLSSQYYNKLINHTRLTNILPGSCLIIERSSNPSKVASAWDVVKAHFSAISSMCIGSVFRRVIIVCSSEVRSKSNLV